MQAKIADEHDQAADAAFRVMVDRHGPGAEANTIVVHLAQEIGIPRADRGQGIDWRTRGVLMAVIRVAQAPAGDRAAHVRIGAGLLGGFSNIATP